MDKVWLNGAWEEYFEWLKKDKRVFKKINEIIKSIDRNGTHCVGKPDSHSSMWHTLFGLLIFWRKAKFPHA